jgi:hypothetical protein
MRQPAAQAVFPCWRCGLVENLSHSRRSIMFRKVFFLACLALLLLACIPQAKAWYCYHYGGGYRGGYHYGSYGSYGGYHYGGYHYGGAYGGAGYHYGYYRRW